ncbi:MAG: hypothetical protein AAFN92_01740, partial [Bacteroidota bacterium]
MKRLVLLGLWICLAGCGMSAQLTPHFRQLDSLLDNGDVRKALALMDTQASSEHPGLIYRQGRARALLGEFPSAIRLLQTALETA